jgi:CO/xanthine dehydrogenase Mo-binding subunit
VTSSRAIGKAMTRVDAAAKVSGFALYPADIRLTQLLWAKTVRSKYPHARILSIDASEAEGYPGVVAVLTHRDMPGPNRYGLYMPDQPSLADHKVRYLGDAVALVVAETSEAAEEGAKLVKVEYEPLAGVFDPAEAMSDEAPLVHEKLVPGDPRPFPRNLLDHYSLRCGEAETAFAQADVVVEADYVTGFAEHAFLDPEAGIAYVDEKGVVTVVTATQWADEDIREMSEALALPKERLRIVQAAIGGAFGGREDISVQIHLALAAIKTQRPVKMVWTREESIGVHAKRHPFRMRYRTAAKADGSLLAVDAQLIADAGAYASTSSVVLRNAHTFAAGPYRVPNVRVDSYVAYTNNNFTAAMRGFGANQVCFAYEQQMDRLAEALGMDPVEIRTRNLVSEGDILPTGQRLGPGTGIRATLEACAAAFRWKESWLRARALSDGTRRRGVGVACGFKNVGYSFGFPDKCSAIVEIYPDQVLVKTGASDVGQGIETVAAQVAAEVLEVPMSQIRVIWNDTALAPNAGSSSASRQTYMVGNAVRLAATQARWVMEERGGREALGHTPAVGHVTYHAPKTQPLDPHTGKADAHFAFCWATVMAEVEVDVETGETWVHRIVTAVDVGFPINPVMVEGQVEGGAAMALGYALTEQYLIKEGRPLTIDLSTYLCPTAVDVPDEIQTVMVTSQDPNGPWGAKGIAEITMIPVTPAIINAIHDATGAWIEKLPATPERVFRAIQQRAKVPLALTT